VPILFLVSWIDVESNPKELPTATRGFGTSEAQ
jgi:hypothetical protein